METLKCEAIWPKVLAEFGKVDPHKRSLTAVFQFNVLKNGRLRKIMTIDCKTLKITDGAIDAPDAVLDIDDDALYDCAKHQISLMECVKGRRASVTGDLNLLQQLNDKFPKK